MLGKLINPGVLISLCFKANSPKTKTILEGICEYGRTKNIQQFIDCSDDSVADHNGCNLGCVGFFCFGFEKIYFG